MPEIKDAQWIYRNVSFVNTLPKISYSFHGTHHNNTNLCVYSIISLLASRKICNQSLDNNMSAKNAEICDSSCSILLFDNQRKSATFA